MISALLQLTIVDAPVGSELPSHSGGKPRTGSLVARLRVGSGGFWETGRAFAGPGAVFGPRAAGGAAGLPGLPGYPG